MNFYRHWSKPFDVMLITIFDMGWFLINGYPNTSFEIQENPQFSTNWTDSDILGNIMT